MKSLSTWGAWAYNLLLGNRSAATVDTHSDASTLASPNSPTLSLLSPIIEEAVRVVRFNSVDSTTVHWIVPHASDTYGTFVGTPRIALQETLRDLFQRSFVALRGGGTIEVVVKVETAATRITILDTSSEIAPRVEKQCHQLIAASQKRVRSWNGQFDVQSTTAGTRISFTVPRAETPSWFVPRLLCSTRRQVVSVDDDVLIHQLWAERLRIPNQEQSLLLAQFTDGSAFTEWVRSHPKRACSLLFLVDFDLHGQPKNGLQLITALGLEAYSILVTGNYEDPVVQQSCTANGIRLLPKDMAASIPLECFSSQNEPTILIEDDPLVRSLWQLVAKSENKSLQIHTKASDFFSNAHRVSLNAPIYVDVELRDGERGEDISRRIADLGFTNIYLTTGHPKWRFGNLPWIRDIIGKAPPWARLGDLQLSSSCH